VAIGSQDNVAQVNATISAYALQLRNLMDQIREQQEFIVGLGLTGLEAMGFSSGDAQSILNMWSYMNTVSGVYYGTVTQGSLFDFDNALSGLWGGQ
jgi:hypothetical protein